VIGRRFGNYRILSLLGQGGMGAVYLAEHPEIGRKVAIKVLHTGFDRDAQVLGRFLNEARAANAIRHPNLIEILDSGTTDDGTPYLVMEFLEGESVAARIRRQGRLPLPQLFEFSKQIASAVGAAHRKGIIHRDLKPENLFIVNLPEVEREFIKVLDFGIAKLQMSAPGSSVKTNSGMLIGTPVYMSPEQCRATKELDARSDIYSLGIILHEMAVGRPPFFSEGFGELVVMHISTPPPPLRSIDPSIPPALEALVLTCLAKSPNDRYASMSDLLAALKDVSGVAYVSQRLSAPASVNDTLPATGTTPYGERVRAVEYLTPVSPTAPPGPAPAFTIQPTQPRTSRRKVLVATAGVISTSAIAGVAYQQGWLGSIGRGMSGIAVLPFENVGGAPENEYYSDGIADEIIDRLTRLKGLRVVSRTSAFQFKGKAVSPMEIGTALNVDALVEGSVQRVGDRLKISARLLDVVSGVATWGNTFQREVSDVFAIQNEIATSVARGVNIQISQNEEKELQTASTSSVKSYDEYLRGRAALFRRTPSDLAMAEFHFKTAINMDPRFALAFCGLSNTQALLSYYSRTPPQESAERALFAAQKALDLDPDLPEALVAMALPTFFYSWDFTRSEDLYARATLLNPNLGQAHHWRCANLMALGQKAEVLPSMKRAVDLDPLSAVFGADLAWFLHLLGEQRPAEKQIENVLRMNPKFSRGHHLAGEIWFSAGKLDKALESFQTAVRLTDGKTPLYVALLGFTQGALKQVDKATDTLKALLADTPMPSFNPALVHLGLGQMDVFFDMLERAVDERSPHLAFWPKYSPIFATARKDKRFGEQMARVKPIG
jgi:eukaryotic-like serine/threonine-protein kinase